MNDKSGRTRSYVILGVTGIVFLLYNIIFFVLSANSVHGASHWVSYVFMLVAFIAVAVTSFLSFGKFADAKDNFMRFPIYAHSLAYLVIELIASSIFMFIDYQIVLSKQMLYLTEAMYYPPAYDYVWILAFLVQLIILVVHVVILFGAFSAKNTIQNIGYKVQSKTDYIRLLKVDAEITAQKAADPQVKAAFMKLAEDIRFSDPMSHESLFELEKQIQECINNAGNCLAAGNNDGALACCNAAKNLLMERNMKTKVLKH